MSALSTQKPIRNFYILSSSLMVSPIIDGGKDRVAIGLQKDSEFTKLFNYHLIKLHESGILDKMEKLHFSPDPVLIPSAAEIEESYKLAYDKVTFPFLVLLLGIALSVGASICEKLKIHRFTKID